MLHFSLLFSSQLFSMASSNLLLVFLFTLLTTLVSSSSSASYFDLFSSWCARHNKTYATHQETLSRFHIFQQNAQFVHAHNSDAAATYTLALNAFADLTPDEFRKTRLGLAGIGNVGREEKKNGNGNGRVFTGFGSGYRVPSSVDWREQGAVTKVKDQGSCGACWSFSATGAMEGINKIVTGSLVSLSEQELIDCDRTYNMGCNGGLMDYAFKWVIKNKGIDSESDYPYKATDGKCNSNKVNHRVVTIDGYTDVLPNRDDLLLQAVAKQPVSVGICGSDNAFQLYSSGIFTGPCSTSLDHAVLIVGYGSQNGQDYWIIKNSWGTSWGMDGYMYMARNTNSSKGVCGINMMPSYPTKTSPNPPPSPDPSPTKCSLLTYCPAGSTCCCSWRVLGVCLSWSCCGLDSAVCCKDTKYCCPQDYPICDTKNQQCLKGNGNTTSVEGIYREDSFIRAGWWNDILAL